MTFVTLCWPLKDFSCSGDWASSSSRQRSTDPSCCTRERSLRGCWPDVERRDAKVRVRSTKTALKGRLITLISLMKFGPGEEIRTLAPKLGNSCYAASLGISRSTNRKNRVLRAPATDRLRPTLALASQSSGRFQLRGRDLNLRAANGNTRVSGNRRRCSMSVARKLPADSDAWTPMLKRPLSPLHLDLRRAVIVSVSLTMR
jgi:hypothetical protein